MAQPIWKIAGLVSLCLGVACADVEQSRRQPAQRAEFDFEVAEAGTYILEGGVYAPDGSTDSFWFTIDGDTASPYLWDTFHSTTYGSGVLQDRSIGTIRANLTAGAHTVAIYLREDGTRLDWLRLARIVDSPAIEAEDAELFGAFEVGSDPAASGGQYIHVPNGFGNQFNVDGTHRAEFTFQVETAGSYAVIGAVHAETSVDDSFFVTVDGLPADGDLWDTQINTEYLEDSVNKRGVTDEIRVDLGVGEHTVTIHLREDGTRLDNLRLELRSGP